MLVGGVTEHLVEQNADALRMRRGDQRVEIGQRAVIGMHALVIGNVIAPVAIGRGMDRRQPDRIDAERSDVVELRDETGKIALPVAVRIHEAA